MATTESLDKRSLLIRESLPDSQSVYKAGEHHHEKTNLVNVYI